MKKNILFVMPSLSAGGAEKSLINLLTLIDYKKYKVDLYLFNNSGLFINSIPSEVNVIESSECRKVFSTQLFKSILYYMKKGQVRLVFNRIIFSFKNRLISTIALSEQYTWKNQRLSFNFTDKNYDIAIGYLEKTSIYFVVDNVRANKRIGWIHTDYSNSGMNPKFDYPYFELLDEIVTVSEECANALEEKFITLKEKIKVIQNIVSPGAIKELAAKDLESEIVFEEGKINIVSVARLSMEKGVDIAINTCKILTEKGFNINWFVLGEGKERKRLESLINIHGLTDNFKLLGTVENPYPFIRNADIYVQPSRYEGKSIAIDEAKILLKPIVVTNFVTATEQIKSGVNGLISEMNPEGLSRKIEILIKNENYRNRLISNLSKEKLGTEAEIQKLYKLM
ncbi:glycosyltransferase [Peribacillus muralis]|uniref:glycosyltransferase n=1 Tax=Peribacillus muralis TaxID=264697 RepID=UPI00070C8CF1|nr:glycosyltransferase [Peribacillus muralis]